MRRSLRLLPFAALLAGSTATAASYTFTEIASTADAPFLSIPLTHAINAAGQVAFTASIPQQTATTTAVYRGDGGAPLLVFEGDSFETGEVPTGPVAIDAAGTVFFVANNPGLIGSQIRYGSGGATQKLVDTNTSYGDLGFSGFGALAAAGAGELAFLAFVDDPEADPIGIFFDDGSGPESVIQGVFEDLGDPALAPGGRVAYRLEEPVGEDGIYRDSAGGSPVAIAQRGTTPFECQFDGCFSESVAIDGTGAVAFRGFFDTGPTTYEEGLFLGSGGAVTTLADSSGAFDVLAFPKLSPNGNLAFYGVLDASPTLPALFAGVDPVNDRVIGKGDALLGSTLSSFFLGGVNDAGQIAFWASLANGTVAIVRADPAPEPGAALAAAAALVSLAALRRR